MANAPAKLIGALVGAIATIAALAGSASAGVLDYGSAAWTNKQLTLFKGPGPTYDILGDISGEIRVRVERCTVHWCLVDSDEGDGWVSRGYLSFGQAPGYALDGPNLHYPAGGPGIVCFFSGKNYTGTSVCSETGFVVHDLVHYNLDNAFASVTVEGNVSVTVCRDRDFRSHCERVIQSEPELSRFLLNAVSSYRVY